MAISGSLSSMPLTDLLQWLGTSRKSGVLEVERHKVVKRIHFRDGAIVACSTQDPPEWLGHFLLSRGRITEDTLRTALARQEETHQFLGQILVEMRAISSAELRRQLEAKTEETIYGLFDWDNAEFRFDEQVEEDPNTFETHVRVEDVLLRGLKRFDEMKRIRTVFYDPGIVLTKTGKKPPLEVTQHRAASRIFEAVDGERTVADILLEVHGSEHLVTKFLFELHRGGFVVISGIRPQTAAEEVPTPAAVVSEPAQAAQPAASDPHPASPTRHRPAAAPLTDRAHAAPESELERARRLMSQGDCDNALEILDGLYRNRPGDDSLRRLVAEAEAAFVEKAYRHYLPASKIPYLKRDAASLTSERFSPVEYFLISRIDGNWDVRSITHIAPIREVDVLRTLKRLRERGLIDLREP